MSNKDYDYNTNPHADLNRDDVPEEAWEEPQKVDMKTGTDRYMQMQMLATIDTIKEEVEKTQEEHPFHTLVILLARNGEERLNNELSPNEEIDYDEGIERYFTQVGNKDYAIDLAIQFAIEASKEFLSDMLDNNPKMTTHEYRQLEKGFGFNMIKRIVDDFELTDDSIDLNQLKGNLSDVIKVTDEAGNEMDI